jgi:hypothetical protein
MPQITLQSQEDCPAGYAIRDWCYKAKVDVDWEQQDLIAPRVVLANGTTWSTQPSRPWPKRSASGSNPAGASTIPCGRGRTSRALRGDLCRERGAGNLPDREVSYRAARPARPVSLRTCSATRTASPAATSRRTRSATWPGFLKLTWSRP